MIHFAAVNYCQFLMLPNPSSRKSIEPNTSLDESFNAALIKRDLTIQLKHALNQKCMSQAELARRMHTSRAVIHRLLDEDDLSVTLATISKAAAVLGQVFRVDASPISKASIKLGEEK